MSLLSLVYKYIFVKMDFITTLEYIEENYITDDIKTTYEVDCKYSDEYDTCMKNFSENIYSIHNCIDWYNKSNEIFNDTISSKIYETIRMELSEYTFACGHTHKWIKNPNFILFIVFQDRSSDTTKFITKISYNYTEDTFHFTQYNPQ